jgi:hypothetical protein
MNGTSKPFRVALGDAGDVPMSAEEVGAAYRTGMLKDSTLVWRAGMDGWEPLSNIAHEIGLTLNPRPVLKPPKPEMGTAEELEPHPVPKPRTVSYPPPSQPTPEPSSEVEQTAMVETFLLVLGMITSGYFLVLYETANNGVHNLGLLQNRLLGAGSGGLMILTSVLIAGFNRRAGKTFTNAILILVVGIGLAVGAGALVAWWRSRGH